MINSTTPLELCCGIDAEPEDLCQQICRTCNWKQIVWLFIMVNLLLFLGVIIDIFLICKIRPQGFFAECAPHYNIGLSYVASGCIWMIIGLSVYILYFISWFICTSVKLCDETNTDSII